MSITYRRPASPSQTIAQLSIGIVSILLFSRPAASHPDSRACDELPRDAFRGARHLHGGPHKPHRHRGHHHHRQEPPPPPPMNPGIPGIDSLANFDVSFTAPGFAADGSSQSSWTMNLVGGPPELGGTTVVNAPVVPVSIDLLDVDGTVRVSNGALLHSDVTPFVQPTLQSPLFQTATYSSSSVPTQFIDAIQRAQFFNNAPADWHTWLAPVVRPARTLAIPFGSYRFALKPDGTCCSFIAVDSQVFESLFFPTDPADVTTPVGAAENAGDITPRDLGIFLLPDTFLTVNGRCCILGFHTYDAEVGDASNGNQENRYVVAVSTWISPGLLSGVEDISALSHELSEAVNDPFVGTDSVHNITPFWQEPSGACQNKNEIADVVEDLPNAVFPLAMPDATYHMQNTALLSWFQPGQPSSAIDAAFSYPDETLLTAPTPLLSPVCQ